MISSLPPHFQKKVMGKSFLVLFICTLMGVFLFQSCQKGSDKDFYQSETLKDEKAIANAWLDSKKTVQSGSRNERVESLRKALNFDGLYTEKAANGAKITVIPVSSDFTSFYNKKKQLSSYLVLTSKGSEVVRGEIVQYIPENPSSQKMPTNAYEKIHTRKNIDGNDSYTLLSIFDRYNFSVSFKNGKLDSKTKVKTKGQVEKETSGAVAPSNVSVNGLECTEWFLITYHFYTDGSYNVADIEYLGTTCQEVGCLPNEWCEPQPEEGGGGPPVTCNLIDEDAESYLDGMEAESSESSSVILGEESLPDGFGEITKPIIISNHSFSWNWMLGYKTTHTYVFTGTLFKTTTNGTWKWKNLAYTGLVTNGTPPPCFTVSVSATVVGPLISSDKITASWSGISQTQAVATCLLGTVMANKTVNSSGNYYSTSF